VTLDYLAMKENLLVMPLRGLESEFYDYKRNRLKRNF